MRYEQAFVCSCPYTFSDGARAGQAWWAAVEDYRPSAPGLVRSLMLGPSVVCDPGEAKQALAWARALPAWDDDDPALAVVSSVSGD